MPDYRCDFLGPDGRLAMRREFTAESDSHALAMARALYAEFSARHGFELWESRRCVHSES